MGGEAENLCTNYGDRSPLEARILVAHLPFLHEKSEAVKNQDADTLTPSPIMKSLGKLHELSTALRDPASSACLEGSPTAEERLLLLRTLSHVALSAGYGDIAA